MSSTTNTYSLKVATGPAGRAMAHPMDESLVESLQQHLTLERSASASYFANAIWFAERELRGFSKYFKQESQTEQIHAGIFADYLIARGQTVKLEAIQAPRQNWESVEEVMSIAFQMEADVTSSLHQLYSMAERSSDMRTTVFLDPTIDGQVKSENEFAHLLGRVKIANSDPSAILIIDGELTNGINSPAQIA